MNSCTLYSEYYELITLLPREERKPLSLAIFEYIFEDIEPTDLTDNAMKIFRNLKRPLDKSKNKSKNASNQNQNEIKTKSNQNQNEIKTETHHDVNVNVDDNVYVNNLENKGYGEKKPLVTDDVSSLTKITKEVLDYLNQKTNSNFRYSSKATQSKINARLNEGYKIDDFIVVINKKCNEWLGTEWEKYLCPETLFGTKFEKYLNQKEIKKQKTNSEKQWEVLKGVYDGTIQIN